MTKYQKNLEWLRPFVDAAGAHVPVYRVTTVRGYKAALGKQIRLVGSCCGTERTGFTIALLTHKQIPGKKAYRSETIENLLVTLAHELAHIAYDEHDVYFASLFFQILSSFIDPLRETGIMDIQQGIK